MVKTSSQGKRAGFFLAYALAVAIINYLLFQEILPTRLWFWSALLALLLGEFISQPFFTAPKDALSNSIATVATVVALLAGSPEFTHSQLILWYLAFGIATAIAGLSLLAIIWSESPHAQIERFIDFSRDLTRLFGAPKVLLRVSFFWRCSRFILMRRPKSSTCL